MPNISGITVRLGGRTILERAMAAIQPRSRGGLIGRNGAGKSTLMKVIIGQLEADESDIEMPCRPDLAIVRVSLRDVRPSTKRLSDPAGAEPDLASLPMAELSRRRAKLGAELAIAEARWLEASEGLEGLAA